MSSSGLISQNPVVRALRDVGVLDDARRMGRLVRRIPMKSHGERVEYGWTLLRWSLHVTALLLAASGVMAAVAGHLVEVVGWLTLAYFANRVAVHTFLIRQWWASRAQRRAYLAEARSNVRRSRAMVRRSRRALKAVRAA